MRIKGTPAELERRRRRAAKLLRQGKGVNEVARIIGASSSSVSRWKTALRRHGDDGLNAKPHPGRQPFLNKAQKRRLLTLIKRGAIAAGHPNDLWTRRRVADLIGRHFGVWHHHAHVWRILRSLGLTVQKPEARARERDEDAIKRWRSKDWPRIKKKRGG